MARDNLDLIWNKAVSKVGGSRNTLSNFKTVAKEFSKLANEQGYTLEQVKEEIITNYKATASFMI